LVARLARQPSDRPARDGLSRLAHSAGPLAGKVPDAQVAEGRDTNRKRPGFGSGNRHLRLVNILPMKATDRTLESGVSTQVGEVERMNSTRWRHSGASALAVCLTLIFAAGVRAHAQGPQSTRSGTGAAPLSGPSAAPPATAVSCVYGGPCSITGGQSVTWGLESYCYINTRASGPAPRGSKQLGFFGGPGAIAPSRYFGNTFSLAHRYTRASISVGVRNGGAGLNNRAFSATGG